MAITAANRMPEVNIILDHHSQAERDMVSRGGTAGRKDQKTRCDRPVQAEVLR
jgi:hypothetical protein